MSSESMKRPRTKPPEVRRDELMDSAQSLFLEKGFTATSVGEIVERADVAKGTFYLYFATKDDVLGALQTRFVDDFCDRVDAAVTREDGGWSQKLDAWIAACVDAYLDKFALHDLVFHQHQPANRAMKSANPVITRLEEMLRTGAAKGAWIIEDFRITAVMLFDAMHGAVDDALTVPAESIDRDVLRSAITRFCRNALRLGG